MFESTRLIVTDILYILANLITASVYLFWADLLPRFWLLAVSFLSNRSAPLPLSLLKLHCLVLASLVLATCFRVTTATVVAGGESTAQHKFKLSSWDQRRQVLEFDDIPIEDTTHSGFGSFTSAYHHLVFNELYPFDPSADAFKDKISPQDLNCAVSRPNSVYGARAGGVINRVHRLASFFATEGGNKNNVPSFSVDVDSTANAGLESFFTLHGMKIKPLDFPLSHTTLYLCGYRAAANDSAALEWQVDFPLGFHDMLHVRIEEFSGTKWNRLERVEIFADLSFDGEDWEFCLDDLEVEFTSSAMVYE